MYGPPQSKYFEIFGPPLKYLDHVRIAPVVHVWLIVERIEGQGFCVLGLMILYSPAVMNQAYRLRLSLPEPHTCQSRGTRCKRTK